MLQIMEEGVLTDSTGRQVSFKNALVVMTSNIGGEIKGDGLGFCPTDRADKTNSLLQKQFTPEFLGRLDKIIHFVPLEQNTKKKIVEKYLGQLKTRVEDIGVQLLWTDEVIQYLMLIKKAEGGARYLRRVVQEEVEGPLAQHLLLSDKQPEKIRICIKNNAVQFY